MAANRSNDGSGKMKWGANGGGDGRRVATPGHRSGTARRPTRRQFLGVAAGLPAFAPACLPTSSWLSRLAWAMSMTPASRQQHDKVLIVVQLTGGNDGLNTVVPYEDDIYARNRPTLRLGPKDVLKIPGEQLGFHPAAANFMKLFEQGRLTIVQGVGYPNASRDHGRAMLNWQTARPADPQCPTGWLGRALDQLYRPDEPALLGALVATIPMPHALYAEHAFAAQVRTVRDLLLQPADPTGTRGSKFSTALQHLAAGQSGSELLEFVRDATVQACETSRRVQQVLAANRGRDRGYPDSGFARRLQTVADLIRAELGVRVFFTEHGGGGFGGFDTHANQAANHGALLEQLADGLAAFVADLERDRLLDRVVLLTFSEFGRTLRENGRRGTDHGIAAPMFLVGGPLKPGLVTPHPSLEGAERINAVPFTVDFRSVYAALLDRWLGVDSRVVIGSKFPHAPIFA